MDRDKKEEEITTGAKKEIMKKIMEETEKQVKEDGTAVPESLSPARIKERIQAMDAEERESRAAKAPESDKPQRKARGRFVYPFIAAASLFVTFGVGVTIGRNGLTRNLSDSAGQSAGSATEAVTEAAAENPADSAKEAGESAAAAGNTSVAQAAGESESNYLKAYRVLNEIKKENESYYGFDRGSGMFYVDMPAAEIAQEEADLTMGTDMYRTESAEDFAFNGAAGSMASAKSAQAADREEASAGEYTDTNVRTEGVAEGDIVKTDGSYLYVYDNRTERVRIYQIKKGDFEELSSVNLIKDMAYGVELYIWKDTLLVLGETDEAEGDEREVVIALYDVSDRKSPKKKDVFTQDGYYHTSRLADGVLYTFSYDDVELGNLRRKEYGTYIPKVGGELIDDADVCVQEDGYNTTYCVITSVGVADGEMIDKKALLAGGDTLYVSTENIYLADRAYDWSFYGYRDTTELLKISYKDGVLRREETGSIPGYLHDEYSIDEYEGYLRLVTTYSENYTNYNALYVLDAEMEKVGVIKRLAESETMRSARFMGKTAYFVTFRNTDPLFSVDLSDPEEPEIMGYLKIPGFSAYLHPYDETHLLGIGYDTDDVYGWTQAIKLTMFDISDPSDVKEEDTKVLKGYEQASVLENANAFMFDAKRGVFGFSVAENTWSEDADAAYMAYVYHTDEEGGDGEKDGSAAKRSGKKEGFERLLDYELTGNPYDSLTSVRGLIADGYLYVVKAGAGITSFDTEAYEIVREEMR